MEREEARHQRTVFQEFVEKIEQEKGIGVDEKWEHYSDWPDPLAWWKTGS